MNEAASIKYERNRLAFLGDSTGEMAPLPTPRIPGYEILRHLGSGGQGSVWLALGEVTSNKVAIKVIHPHHIEQKRQMARFEDAYVALSQLSHPGIVTPFARGVLVTGELWHATEFIEGWNLDEYVDRLDQNTLSHLSGDRSGKFPVRSVLLLVVKVCDAVAHAHRNGIIHRDLKPDNIIVDQEANPHILDFGLAKFLHAEKPAMLTLSDQFVGTPNWASPEQVEGKPGHVDTRSDVYSLGVILYQLLTGEFPYEVNKGLARKMEQICFAEPIRPRARVSWVDRDLEAILLKALAKEPSKRYQSVANFREDIDLYLDGRPIHARGDSLAYRAFKLARRNRMATAALVALCIVSTTYVIQLNRYARRMSLYATEAARRLRMARETLEENIRDTADELSRLTGAQPLRKRLYERSYARLAELVEERPSDPALLEDYAQAHRLLGDIAYQLSQTEQSLSHRRAALNIWSRLVEANPNDLATRHERSIALVLVGDIHKERGDIAEARRLYEESLSIDEELAAANPVDISYQDTLCYSYERTGMLRLEMGDVASARVQFSRRHELAQRLFDQSPDSPGCLKNLINSHLHLIGLAANDEDGTSIGEHRRISAELSRQLVEKNPDDPACLHLRATVLLGLAVFEASNEATFDRAEAAVQEVLDIAKRLNEAEPGHPFYDVYLTDAYGVLGGIAQARGDAAAALQYAEKAYDVALEGTRRRPDDWFCQTRLAGILVSLCETTFALGDLAKARELGAQAAAAWQALTKAASNRPDVLLQRAEFLLHCPIEDLRDPVTAVSLSEKAVKLRKGVRPSDWLLLADAHAASGNPNEASRSAQEGLRRLPEGDSPRRRELEVRLRRLADPGIELRQSDD